jgi:hypothetical protein
LIESINTTLAGWPKVYANAEGRTFGGAYEDGALATFTKAKLGIQCDLPIGYWRTAELLLEEERNLRPDWASTLTSSKTAK